MRHKFAISEIYVNHHSKLYGTEFRGDMIIIEDDALANYLLLLEFNIKIQRYICYPKLYIDEHMMFLPELPDLMVIEFGHYVLPKLVYIVDDTKKNTLDIQTIELFCSEHYLIYELLKISDILKNQVEISNWKFLISESNNYSEDKAFKDIMLRDLIYMILATDGAKKINRLLKVLSKSHSPEKVKNCIFDLLLKQLLLYNFKNPITDNSLVWLP